MERVRKELNRRGRRMTPQRAAILDVLQHTKSHPTAEAILEDVQRAMPKISLGTVYRNLQVLVEEGYAVRLPSSHGSHRFDGDTSDHHHVVCDRCGAVEDVFFQRAPEILRRVARETGYTVFRGQTLFAGLCPDCRNRTSDS